MIYNAIAVAYEKNFRLERIGRNDARNTPAPVAEKRRNTHATHAIPHATPSGYPFSPEEDLLDQVRSGVGGTLDDVRRVVSNDLTDLLSGALSIEAARHYYRHNRG